MASNGWNAITCLEDTGHLTYFLSSKRSELPIRRVETGVDYGHKSEPHYEDMTYGHFSCCICRNRIKAVQEGRRYMFFATEYQGLTKKYQKRTYIVGFYRMTSFHERPHYIRHERAHTPCVAVRADKMIFVRINDAFELNDAVWLRWFRRELPMTKDGRPFLQGIVSTTYESGLGVEKVREILNYLTEMKDATEGYLFETRRVSEP